MTCKKCNTLIPDESIYCQNCGRRLVEEKKITNTPVCRRDEVDYGEQDKPDVLSRLGPAKNKMLFGKKMALRCGIVVASLLCVAIFAAKPIANWCEREASRQSYIEQANAHVAAGQYESAIKCLDDCIKEYGHSNNIEKLKDAYLADYRSSFFDKAAAHAEVGDYVEAVECLKRGIKYFGVDRRFTSRIEDYESFFMIITLEDLMDHLELVNSSFLETYGVEVDWSRPYYLVYENEESYKNNEEPIILPISENPSSYWFSGWLYKVENFNGFEDWESHLRKYLSHDIVESWKSNPMLEYTLKVCDGVFYLQRGARGYGAIALKLDTARLVSVGEGKCSVLVDCYYFNEFDSTYQIDFQFTRGRWVVVSERKQ